jgi:hypothetical protein
LFSVQILRHTTHRRRRIAAALGATVTASAAAAVLTISSIIHISINTCTAPTLHKLQVLLKVKLKIKLESIFQVNYTSSE